MWLLLNLGLRLMVMMLVLVVVMQDYVALVRRGIGLYRVPRDISFLGGFRLYGCWSWWCDGVHIYKTLRGCRLVLKGYV